MKTFLNQARKRRHRGHVLWLRGMFMGVPGVQNPALNPFLIPAAGRKSLWICVTIYALSF